MIEEKPAFNENLYSRQIGVFGAEAMGKLVKLRVFIQGLRGVRFYLPRLVSKPQRTSSWPDQSLLPSMTRRSSTTLTWVPTFT